MVSAKSSFFEEWLVYRIHRDDTTAEVIKITKKPEEAERYHDTFEAGPKRQYDSDVAMVVVKDNIGQKFLWKYSCTRKAPGYDWRALAHRECKDNGIEVTDVKHLKEKYGEEVTGVSLGEPINKGIITDKVVKTGTLSNTSPLQQSQTMGYEVQELEIHGLEKSRSLAIRHKVEAGVTLKFGANAVMAHHSTELRFGVMFQSTSAEGTKVTETTQSSKKRSFSWPIAVPAYSELTVSVVLTTGTFEVPVTYHRRNGRAEKDVMKVTGCSNVHCRWVEPTSAVSVAYVQKGYSQKKRRIRAPSTYDKLVENVKVEFGLDERLKLKFTDSDDCEIDEHGAAFALWLQEGRKDLKCSVQDSSSSGE